MADLEAVSAVKELAQTVKATVEAIKAVSDLLEDAERSVVVEINNVSYRPLKFVDAHSESGGFKVPAPLVIKPMSTSLFGHESTGFLTGSEGKVTYSLDDGGTTFWLEWSNPFIGAGSINLGVVGTNADWYAATGIRGGGNSAHHRFQIGDAALASATQLNWQTCGECKLLFHLEGEGSCPGSAGFDVFFDPDAPPHEGGGHSFTAHGPHAGAGYLFKLPYGRPGPNREPGWRKCGACGGLFYDGWPQKGRCTGRLGGHQAVAGGKDFHIPFNVAEEVVGSGQHDWRFCTKCQGLFYLPHNNDAECAAGGKHEPNSDYDYVLPRS